MTEAACRALELGRQSRVLIINTEGDTDAAAYRRLHGSRPSVTLSIDLDGLKTGRHRIVLRVDVGPGQPPIEVPVHILRGREAWPCLAVGRRAWR